jgi:hypothetical protein
VGNNADSEQLINVRAHSDFQGVSKMPVIETVIYNKKVSHKGPFLRRKKRLKSVSNAIHFETFYSIFRNVFERRSNSRMMRISRFGIKTYG